MRAKPGQKGRKEDKGKGARLWGRWQRMCPQTEWTGPEPRGIVRLGNTSLHGENTKVTLWEEAGMGEDEVETNQTGARTPAAPPGSSRLGVQERMRRGTRG